MSCNTSLGKTGNICEHCTGFNIISIEWTSNLFDKTKKLYMDVSVAILQLITRFVHMSCNTSLGKTGNICEIYLVYNKYIIIFMIKRYLCIIKKIEILK